MMRIPRFRRARTAVALVALTATTGAMLLVGAAPASAATATWTVVSSSSPTIFPSTTNQSGGNETVTTTGGTVTIGDQLVLKVDDSGGGNCALTNDFIEFAAAPTLAVTAPTTAPPTYSVALASSAGACTTAGKKDEVVVTATGSGPSGTFTLSGIKYNTGSAVDGGAVVVTGTTNAGTVDTTSASNATISVFKVTANTPPVGVAESTTGNAISDITIQEFTPGAIPTGFVCATINSGQGDFSAVGGVSAAGGGAVASGAHLGGNTASATPVTSVSFANTGSSTGPAIYTLTGLKFDSTGGLDDVSVRIGSSATDRDTACGDSNITSAAVITFVADVTRLGGGDRFATAQIIFDNEFFCNEDIVIARGDNFPDALAASYLAGNHGTGILLVNTDSIPASTMNEVRLAGVHNVFLIGGTSAISTAVEDQFKATAQHDCEGGVTAGTPTPTLNVTRIAGADRFETAQNVAEFPGLSNPGTTDLGLNNDDSGTTCQPVVTAIVASGENFPDALAAGPLAADGSRGFCGNSTELPLLLTQKDSLSTAAANALVDMNVKQVILMGGTAAVSSTTETAITALGINVIRVAGANRQATAAALATLLADRSNIDFDDGRIGLTRGDNFPDALTLGPAAGDGSEERAILLTDSPTSLGSAAGGVFTNLSSKVNLDGSSPDCTDDIHVAGGTGAVSAGAVQEALNAAAAQSPVNCLFL